MRAATYGAVGIWAVAGLLFIAAGGLLISKLQQWDAGRTTCVRDLGFTFCFDNDLTPAQQEASIKKFRERLLAELNAPFSTSTDGGESNVIVR